MIKNEIYKKNLEEIEKINKNLHKNLLIDQENENIEFISENNFLIKLGAKEILAYQKDKEFESVDNSLKDVSLFQDECTIQIGIGNGYMLSELLKKANEKHTIVLIEPLFFLLNNSFCLYDFSDFLKKGNLLICSNKEELIFTLNLLEANKVIQLWHSFIENYTVFLSSFYSELTKMVMDTINQIMCNTGTVMGAGSIIAENDIKNLPYVVKHRGINEIKNLYKNKPAIVILSAPTVIELLPQLLDDEIRKRIIIIAVAQMLRPLLAFGITPDFICTVDFGPVNYEHFENLFWVKNVPLVALNRSYSEILKDWEGPKFIVTGYNPANENTVVNFLNDKGQLEQGGSVGHMAIGLAIHLGCDPIIHIGFDCAYDSKNLLSHNKLGDAIGKIKIENGQLDWEVIDPNSSLNNSVSPMGSVVYVPGYFNEPVPTNVGLSSFITALENIFKSYPEKTFINSCENGAKKKFCVQMSLKKALKDYCKKKINKKVIKKYLTYKPYYMQDVLELKRRLKWEINLFEQVIKNCDLALEPLKKLFKSRKEDFDLLLAENEKFAIAAQELTKQSNILSLHIYKTSREIQKKELKVNGKIEHLKKDKDDLKIRIERSKKILEEAKNSSIKLKEIYEDVLKQMEMIHYEYFEKEVSEKKYELLDDKFEKWEKLLENGNWARPLLETVEIMEDNFSNEEIYNKAKVIYFKAYKMKSDFLNLNKQRKDRTDEIEVNNFIDLSREYGLKKDFKNALRMLKKAKKINSLKVEVVWGLATTYHFLGKINKSLKYYKFLIKYYPENNLRYRFEMGQVFLLKDIQKGILILKGVLEETKEFDSFYKRLAELEFGMENYYEAKNYCEKYLSVYPHSKDIQELLRVINEKVSC